jgi:hypothetical protein
LASPNRRFTCKQGIGGVLHAATAHGCALGGVLADTFSLLAP